MINGLFPFKKLNMKTILDLDTVLIYNPVTEVLTTAVRYITIYTHSIEQQSFVVAIQHEDR